MIHCVNKTIDCEVKNESKSKKKMYCFEFTANYSDPLTSAEINSIFCTGYAKEQGDINCLLNL